MEKNLSPYILWAYIILSHIYVYHSVSKIILLALQQGWLAYLPGKY